MQKHSIAGSGILIRGPRSPVTEAVVEMFRLSRPVDRPDSVCISVFDLHGTAALNGALPRWLCAKLVTLPPSEVVSMLYGHEDDFATVAFDGSAWQCAWMKTGGREIRYVSCKKTDNQTPLSVSTVLVPMLREVLAARNKLLLHAAAVRCPNGCGVLVLADSGGGKTTTALSILRLGGWLLSDDLAVLQAVDQNVQVTGFPEPLNLTDQTVRFFPELLEHLNSAARTTATEKTVVSAQRVYGNAHIVTSCRLHAIFFVRIEPQGPRARLTNPEQALGKLLRAHTFAQSQHVPKASVSCFFSILDRIPTFELHTGPDPVKLGRWTNEFCRTRMKQWTGER